MSAAVLIAAAVEAACDVDQALPMRPVQLQSRIAYVEPADPWKEHDASYCGLSVKLDVWLAVGAASDMTEAFEWLDAESTKVMNLGPIELADDTVEAVSVGRPVVLIQDGAAQGQFIGCKIEFARFTEESA